MVRRPDETVQTCLVLALILVVIFAVGWILFRP